LQRQRTEPPLIAGPVAQPRRPLAPLPPAAWDTHAHLFGPANRFPFADGRGYTPPEAPAERDIALHNPVRLFAG